MSDDQLRVAQIWLSERADEIEASAFACEVRSIPQDAPRQALELLAAAHRKAAAVYREAAVAIGPPPAPEAEEEE